MIGIISRGRQSRDAGYLILRRIAPGEVGELPVVRGWRSWDAALRALLLAFLLALPAHAAPATCCPPSACHCPAPAASACQPAALACGTCVSPAFEERIRRIAPHPVNRLASFPGRSPAPAKAPRREESNRLRSPHGERWLVPSSHALPPPV